VTITCFFFAKQTSVGAKPTLVCLHVSGTFGVQGLLSSGFNIS